MSDGLFWAAILDEQGQLKGIGRGTSPTPGAAMYSDVHPRYLRLVDGAVVHLSDAECNAIDEAWDAEQQAAAEARAQQEAARQAAEATAQATHDATVQAYRDAYAGATAQLCELAGLEVCRVLTMSQVQEAVMPLLAGPNAGLVNGLLTLLTNVEGKLCRVDGPDALDRV
jgi:hypothetical protein